MINLTTHHQMWYVGVDGGGSRTRLLLTNASGNIFARGEGGACNVRLGAKQCWQSLERALMDAFSRADLSWPPPKDMIMHAVMGLAGTEDPESLQAFLSSAHPFVDITVVSDAEAACLGAHAGADGAIIVIGTGAIGYQRIQGETQRVSGYGFLYDDQGSGAWLGLQACQWVLRAHDQRCSSDSRLISAILQKHLDFESFLEWLYTAKAADFSALVPLITSLQEDDALARELLQAAAHHIEEIHRALVEKQRQRGVILPCVLMGGAQQAIYPYLSESMRANLTFAKELPEQGVLRLLPGFREKNF